MRKNDSGDKGRVKLRIVEFELDGNDATLQESLRSISAAINRATAGPAVKRVEALPAAARPTPKNGHGHQPVGDVADDLIEGDADSAADEGTDTLISTPRTRAARSYPQPKILPDIDFNAADTPLKKFVEEKKPKSHNMKFLAVTAWFAEHGNVQETTSDHVYTAYRAMDWKSRKNMAQPFYLLKDRGWVKQTDGGWAITHIGLDKVKELPAGD